MPTHQRAARTREQLLIIWPEQAGAVGDVVAPPTTHSDSSKPAEHKTEAVQGSVGEDGTIELVPLPDGPERQALLLKYAQYAGEEAAQELNRACRPGSSHSDGQARIEAVPPPTAGTGTSPGRSTSPSDGNFDNAARSNTREKLEAELLAILAAIKTIDDAKARKVDPRTGKQPVTSREKVALDHFYEDEPAGLQHIFNVRMDEYATIFGSQAADSLRRSLRDMILAKSGNE